MKSTLETPENRIQTLAASCVRCGLCISSCPTYALEHTEAESPRGRIAIANALATHALNPTASVRLHLDQCLGCRTCEAVCPADVQFGELIDHSQSLLSQKTRSSFFSWTAWMRRILANRTSQHISHVCLYYLEYFKIRAFLRKIGLLRCLKLSVFDRYLPPIPKPHPFQTHYPTQEKRIGQVGLFLGCATNIFSQETFTATIRLLNTLGYDVVIPRHQTCCGALSLHAGDPAQFMKLLQQNRAGFSETTVDAILSIASGCTSTLGEYMQYLPESIAFAHKIQDPCTFILKILEQRTTPLSIKPLNKRVAIHTPCTLKNVRKSETDVIRLLRYIPNITLLLPENQPGCCGGAGEYALLHPEKAALLGEQTVCAFEKMNPDLVVTSNIGCELQLRQPQKIHENPLQITHPIALFAGQIAS